MSPKDSPIGLLCLFPVSHPLVRVWEVFRVFLRLGLTSFGGPSAHIAYFREEFVNRLKWLEEESFASFLALCQFLPGPASSQFGLIVGHTRAGVAGAFAAWLGFTLPSAILMIAFGLGMLHYAPAGDPGWLQGLRVAVVVVVARAVWGMAQTLCPGRVHLTLAFLSAILVLALKSPWAQVAVIASGGVLGCALFPGPKNRLERKREPLARRGSSPVWLALFFVLLLATPFVAKVMGWEAVEFAHGFYRSGALVFGGGHVVLPLLRDLVVPPGWMTDEIFMAGYGAAQALPGPLFTISAYLGTISTGPVRGVLGGMLALFSIFLPGWLLVLGVLPHWRRLSGTRWARPALQGANSAVVGLLLAALYEPVWMSGILGPRHAMVGLALFALLGIWGWPPWCGVLLAAGLGALVLG